MSDRTHYDLIENEMELVRNRLRKAVDESDMTIEEIARQLNLTRGTIQKYLNGNIDIPLRRYFSILDLTETSNKYCIPDKKYELMIERTGAEYDLQMEIETMKYQIEKESKNLSLDDRMKITHSFLEIVTVLTKPC